MPYKSFVLSSQLPSGGSNCSSSISMSVTFFVAAGVAVLVLKFGFGAIAMCGRVAKILLASRGSSGARVIVAVETAFFP